MKRIWHIFVLLALTACDNNFLESDNREELVVEGWIESGHAPVVLVSGTLPVSSTPQPLSSISEHIFRYAEVYIDHSGGREYLTARLSDKFSVSNYFTSPTLRGKPGETYRLHVKWLDFEASAVCTVPEPVAIDSIYFEKAVDDTSFVAKLRFRNNPGDRRFYQSFRRIGSRSNPFDVVNFTTLNGALMDTVITETFMKPLTSQSPDVYFHPGDTVSLKLAAIEKPMYDFWSSFANYSNSAGTVFSAPVNVKGNVSGAIGYWAGYGIDFRELLCNETNSNSN